VAQLAAAQWIMPKSVGMGAFVRDLFGDSHLSALKTTVTTDNISFMVAMLKDMDLLTIAPRFVLATDIANGSVVRLAYSQPRQKLSVGLIYLRERHLTTALMKFRDTAILLGAKLLPV
jgi:DNA-binding transcriptional LysR family regulator